MPPAAAAASFTPPTAAAATAAKITERPAIAGAGSESAWTAITAVIGRTAAVRRIAFPIRARIAWRRAFETMIVETVAPRRGAQHPAIARIGVVPDHASVRRHPFEVIMRIARRPIGG